MMRSIAPVIVPAFVPAMVTAAVLLVGCAAEPRQSGPHHSPGHQIAEGTVTGIGSEFGNVYTSIAPDQYEALGLEPGMQIHVAFDHAALTLPVGRAYADVPVGAPLAVLHREGLTFAIRDADFNTTYDIAPGARFTISSVPTNGD